MSMRRILIGLDPATDPHGRTGPHRSAESDPTATLHRLLLLLAVLTPAAGLLAGLAARLLARRVLSPVGSLTAAAEHITATGDLSTPVPVRGRDEVGRLGRAFTAMTAALDGRWARSADWSPTPRTSCALR